MDLSKLPKLSETDKHRPPSQALDSPPADPQPLHVEPRAGSAGPEAWISIAVGLILLLMSPRIWQYLLHRVAGSSFTWTFNDAAGNPLTYPQTVFFWGDIALALFAIVLVVEGLVIGFARWRGAVAAALALTILATVLNLGYVVWMMQQGYGLQIMPALAAAFGVYIAMYQKKLLDSLR
jgi:hypothetical protein